MAPKSEDPQRGLARWFELHIRTFVLSHRITGIVLRIWRSRMLRPLLIHQTRFMGLLDLGRDLRSFGPILDLPNLANINSTIEKR